MDKRIIKTKKNIKATLIKLLSECSFEQLTITNLCKAGEIGRITFYTYYEDKYALVDEIFQDFIAESKEYYRQLQNQNNPEANPQKGYTNLLTSILNLFDTHKDFFTHTTPDKNPYLYTMMYRSFFSTLTSYIQSHGKLFPAKYPSELTAALICNGLCGVLSECQTMHLSYEKTKELTLSMYEDLLCSALFSKK